MIMPLFELEFLKSPFNEGICTLWMLMEVWKGIKNQGFDQVWLIDD